TRRGGRTGLGAAGGILRQPGRHRRLAPRVCSRVRGLRPARERAAAQYRPGRGRAAGDSRDCHYPLQRGGTLDQRRRAYRRGGIGAAMKRAILVSWLLLLMLVVAGCQMPAGPTREAPAGARTPGALRSGASTPAVSPSAEQETASQPTAAPTPTNLPVATTAPVTADAPAGPMTITIFYTNDEHGWMEGMAEGEGAASMLANWQEAGYDPDGPYLALSGGDMWTGPAISTWFEGEGMVEVMNGMGYAAA